MGGKIDHKQRPQAPYTDSFMPQTSLTKHKFKDKILRILRWQLQSTKP